MCKFMCKTFSVISGNQNKVGIEQSCGNPSIIQIYRASLVYRKRILLLKTVPTRHSPQTMPPWRSP